MMARPSFLYLLLLFTLISHGFGRRLMADTGGVGVKDHSWVELQENEGEGRGTLQVMDYDMDPKANTNPRTGGFINGPPPHG